LNTNFLKVLQSSLTRLQAAEIFCAIPVSSGSLENLVDLQ